MKNLWTDAESAQFAGDLGQRVYTSRLLGRDASLVLHGGGNTSVKIREVAELAAEMCGDLFAKTTGAQLPVDGGNDRVI